MGKKVPEINSSSMADISFMLLIFFLVATTMDTDKGLFRMLPPYQDPTEQQEDIKVLDKNLFVVLVNKDDKLMVEKTYELSRLTQSVQRILVEYEQRQWG